MDSENPFLEAPAASARTGAKARETKKKKRKAGAKSAAGRRVALVRRARRLPPDDVRRRVEALLGDGAASAPAAASTASSGGSGGGGGGGYLSHISAKTEKRAAAAKKPSPKPTFEVATKRGPARAAHRRRNADADDDDEAAPAAARVDGEADHDATTAEKRGRTLLHRAVRDQSYRRPLPHHQRQHDYEFQLRGVATRGIVRLFNSLVAAQRAGEKAGVDAEDAGATLDKAQDKKLVASRNAFLAELRRAKPAQQL